MRKLVLRGAALLLVFAVLGEMPQAQASPVYMGVWGVPGAGPGEFNYVEGLDVGADGNVHTLEYSTPRLQNFDGSGGFLSQWSLDATPSAVGVDSSGNIYPNVA